MEILSQNKFSSLGMLLGTIALIVGIVHFSLGPFSSPPPTLETVVAEQVAAVKKGIIAGLTGKSAAVEEKNPLILITFCIMAGFSLRWWRWGWLLLAACVRRIAGG